MPSAACKSASYSAAVGKVRQTLISEVGVATTSADRGLLGWVGRELNGERTAQLQARRAGWREWAVVNRAAGCCCECCRRGREWVGERGCWLLLLAAVGCCCWLLLLAAAVGCCRLLLLAVVGACWSWTGLLWLLLRGCCWSRRPQFTESEKMEQGRGSREGEIFV